MRTPKDPIMADRIGNALARDVGGGAMHRLIEGLTCSALLRSFRPAMPEGSMPSDPVSMAATSDSMSPKGYR